MQNYKLDMHIYTKNTNHGIRDKNEHVPINLAETPFDLLAEVTDWKASKVSRSMRHHKCGIWYILVYLVTSIANESQCMGSRSQQYVIICI